jgi:kynurenine formamidase
MPLVDLSHTIEEGMVTYKDLPAPVVCDFISREASQAMYDEGTEFQIGRIDLVGNTGTYVDAPFHRFADGIDLAELPLESIADLDGVTLRWEIKSDTRAIGPDLFHGVDLAGRAILINTGWDRHWRTDAYFEGHPYLTADAAQCLKDHGARMVGIDSYNIDDTEDGARPAHTILLGNGIPICEHMTGLRALPPSDFRFSAVPPKVRAMGTFPVRAFARI